MQNVLRGKQYIHAAGPQRAIIARATPILKMKFLKNPAITTLKKDKNKSHTTYGHNNDQSKSSDNNPIFCVRTDT